MWWPLKCPTEYRSSTHTACYSVLQSDVHWGVQPDIGTCQIGRMNRQMGIARDHSCWEMQREPSWGMFLRREREEEGKWNPYHQGSQPGAERPGSTPWPLCAKSSLSRLLCGTSAWSYSSVLMTLQVQSLAQVAVARNGGS